MQLRKVAKAARARGDPEEVCPAATEERALIVRMSARISFGRNERNCRAHQTNINALFRDVKRRSNIHSSVRRRIEKKPILSSIAHIEKYQYLHHRRII